MSFSFPELATSTVKVGNWRTTGESNCDHGDESATLKGELFEGAVQAGLGGRAPVLAHTSFGQSRSDDGVIRESRESRPANMTVSDMQGALSY